MDVIRQLIRRFASNAGRGHRVKHRVSALVDEYFADPSRRDGRGRKSQSLCKVKRTLEQLNHATAWQCRPGLDPNVRREARALVRTACHGQVPFEELMERASKLRGRVNSAGAVRNACQPIEGCEPLRETLPLRFSVERLHTVEMLAKAGRLLGNCARNNGYGLHDSLRQRESDFYLIRHGDEPVALLEVDLETSKITGFLGKQNADVELPRYVLIDLLRLLGLNGDDVEACLQQGAASIFTTGSAEVRKPDWQRGNLRIWWGARRLVVREGRKRRRWSSFEWDGADWVAADASRRWRLDALMTRHPTIAVLAHKASKWRSALVG